MSVEQCIAGVRDILGDETLKESDLKAIAKEVQRRARQLRERNNAQAEADVLGEAAQAVTDDVRRATLIERRNRALNILAYDRAMNRIQAGLDEGLTLRESIAALTVGTEGQVVGGRRSVYANANARFNAYLADMVDELRREGLLEILTKRKGPEGQGEGYLDLEIAREMRAVSAGEPSVTGIPEARRIAEIFHRVQEGARLDQNRVGAAIGKRWDYIVRQTHDPSAIMKVGRETWVENILPLLDESTFDGSDPVKFLNQVYKNIVSGDHFKAADAAPHDITFTGPANLAKKISQHRILHFKDADAWYAYNQEFGKMSLVESMIRGLDRAAENTALMETFGTNPRAMFDNILRAVEDKYFTGDEPPIGGWARDVLENEFKEIDGTTRQVGHMTLANVGSWIRAFQAYSKLGMSTITSVTDIGSSISELRWQDRDLFGAVTDYLQEGFRFSSDARLQAETNLVGLDSLKGDIAARWNAEDNFTGTLAKLNRLYYKLNFLGPWTDGRKRAVNAVMAHELAGHLRGGLDDVPPQYRKVMEAYDIGEPEWRVMQQVEMRARDGREYFTLDGLRALPDEAFNPIVGDAVARIDADIESRRADLESALERAQTDEARTDAQNKLRTLEAQRARRRNAAIDRAKDELFNKVGTFYVDRADAAVPTPGARERAIINRGTMRGTPAGEFLRFIGQLKMFSITAISRNIVRDIGAHGLRAALREGRGDLIGLASHIAMTTMFGMMALQLKEMIKGKTPQPVFGEEAAQAWTAALLQGGGLGIYGDLLLQNYNEYGRSPQEALLGPGIAGMFDALALLQTPFTDPENFGPRFNRFVQSNTPGINLFYTKAALDYLILWRFNEWVDPGYSRRLERRTEDKGQQFIGPSPTEVVAQ